MIFRGSLLAFIISTVLIVAAIIAGKFELAWLEKLEQPFVLFPMLAIQIASMIFIAKQAIFAKQKLVSDPAYQIQQQRIELEKYQEQLQQEFQAEASRLDQQSRKLADRFCAIHEWLDSPAMLDLQSHAHSGDALAAMPAESLQHDIAEKDRQVAQILDASAEKIYENIRNNTYAPQGQFDPKILRDDLMQIAYQIANIYQPELENPLLSTSPEQLARALNRIGLHLLAVMDQLPLDLKSYNIQQTYDSIRTAIKAYGTYKKAAPYLNWVTKGAYFGRVVASTNPLTIGLMWGATELGKLGAQKAASHFIDQQAIGMMQSVVRVIGYEVASIYSEGFRYRDPAWCYGVELTHLMLAFPDSREKLQHLLQELGRLEIRNEYDRLALYRAIVAGKTIDRNITHPELLDESERKKIIELLEKIHREILHGTATKEAEKWKQDVQTHLGLQLSLTFTDTATTEHSEVSTQQILKSLAAFLSILKQYSPDEIVARLKNVARNASGGKLNLSSLTEEEITQAVNTNSPLEFIPPDIDPQDSRVDCLLNVLCELYAEQQPYSVEVEMMIVQFGLYYRRDRAAVYDSILNAFQAAAIHHFPDAQSVLQQAKPEQCKAILVNQSTNKLKIKSPFTIFSHVEVKQSGVTLPEDHFLLLTGHELLLFEAGALGTESNIIWKADDSTKIDNTSGVLTASALLTGGQNFVSSVANKTTEISIQAPMTARFQQYFESLVSFLNAS